MSEQTPQRDALEPLLADLLDGGLSSEQVEQLQTLLQGDPAQREFYVRFLMTHALLRWTHAAPSAPSGQVTTAEQTPAPVIAPQPQVTDQENFGIPSGPSAGSFPFGFGSTMGGVFFYPIVLGIVLMCGVGAAVLLPKLFTPTAAPAARNSDVVIEAGHGFELPSRTAVGSVARLTAAVQCNWSDSTPVVKIGDSISVGQSLKLQSGVAEITFDIGARVILQSPASLLVDSPKSIRLDTGKLTAEITTERARGFRVLTPEATFVDQGTEFGVEVSPGGNSRIHVFKGAVDLALGNKPGSAVPTHRLLASSGALLEAGAPHVTFVDDTGESFLRSIDERDRDLHVVAYWRFEDHPVNTLLPDTKKNTEATRATVDSSFNGNDLFTYYQRTRPSFSKDVAATIVPQNGRLNRSCLDNTEFPGPVSTRDVYTYSAFSHASPIDIQRITPAAWTIEASVKVMELGRTETFVGRDGAQVRVNVPPRVAFQITAEGHLVVRFIDVENRTHEALAENFLLEAERWYHVAAVSNGKQLLLYADSLDGNGYRRVAATDLPPDGLTALGNGAVDAVWTLGRGKAQSGSPGQWFRGWIDEVRICDIALEPSAFLFAEPDK